MKKRSRRIKYATYKSLLVGCTAYDYDPKTKSIMVDLPDEVIDNPETLCDGWDSLLRRTVGDIYGGYGSEYRSAEIYKRTRDGITIYECTTIKRDESHPFGEKRRDSFINYKKAIAWCNEIF